MWVLDFLLQLTDVRLFVASQDFITKTAAVRLQRIYELAYFQCPSPHIDLQTYTHANLQLTLNLCEMNSLRTTLAAKATSTLLNRQHYPATIGTIATQCIPEALFWHNGVVITLSSNEEIVLENGETKKKSVEVFIHESEGRLYL
ncbi:hypothetical protein GQX74_013333 [Glossina fuscipes]|nr:hypothetical protein GQX74_013333 [Glossina fuscipes]